MISVGDVFGDWIVQVKTNRFSSAGRYWGCLCVCGTYREVNAQGLRRGESKSCGCRRAQKHFMTRTYSVWCGLRGRCNNPNNPSFSHYGGRGISVCTRWDSYDLFLEDMGSCPDNNQTIERLNVDGNYEPENCIWIPRARQARNKQNTIYITHNDLTLTLADWAEKLDIQYNTLWARYDAGWSVSDLVGRPVRSRRS